MGKTSIELFHLQPTATQLHYLQASYLNHQQSQKLQTQTLHFNQPTLNTTKQAQPP